MVIAHMDSISIWNWMVSADVVYWIDLGYFCWRLIRFIFWLSISNILKHMQFCALNLHWRNYALDSETRAWMLINGIGSTRANMKTFSCKLFIRRTIILWNEYDANITYDFIIAISPLTCLSDITTVNELYNLLDAIPFHFCHFLPFAYSIHGWFRRLDRLTY